MSTIKTILGDTWPISGAASIGSTGFSSVTGGTHSTADTLPSGSTSSGLIESTVGGTISFRMDATSAYYGTNESHYGVVFWLRFVKVSALTNSAANQFYIATNSGTKLRGYFYSRTTSGNEGFSPTLQEFVTGGVQHAIAGIGASGGPPVIPLNKWVRVGIHVSRSTSNGVFRLYINGQLIWEFTGLPTDGEVLQANLRNAFNLGFGAAGCKAQIIGPLVSYDDADPITQIGFPDFTLNSANDDVAAFYYVNPTTSGDAGKCWTLTGTATPTRTVYNSSGAQVGRHRYVYTGSTSASWNQQLKFNVGNLPYNERNWASFAMPMMFIPNGTAQININNIGNSNIVTLDISGGQLRKSGVNLAPWASADRQAVAIHLSSTGSIKGSLFDLTALNSETSGVYTAYSFDLGTWAPTGIGKITISGTLGISASECDGVALCRWLPIAGVDSLSHNTATSVSPNLAVTNHFANRYADPQEPYLVPGGAYLNCDLGVNRRHCLIVMGRSGQTRRAFQNSVTEPCINSRGIKWIECDGGSINEYASVINLSGSALKTDQLIADKTSMYIQASNTDCKVFSTTMIRREYTLNPGRTYASYINSEIDRNNTLQRDLVSTYQSSWQHIEFADVALNITNHSNLFVGAADNTHPAASGAILMAQVAVQNTTIPNYITPSIPGASGSNIIFIGGGMGIGIGLGIL